MVEAIKQAPPLNTLSGKTSAKIQKYSDSLMATRIKLRFTCHYHKIVLFLDYIFNYRQPFFLYLC